MPAWVLQHPGRVRSCRLSSVGLLSGVELVRLASFPLGTRATTRRSLSPATVAGNGDGAIRRMSSSTDLMERRSSSPASSVSKLIDGGVHGTDQMHKPTTAGQQQP